MGTLCLSHLHSNLHSAHLPLRRLLLFRNYNLYLKPTKLISAPLRTSPSPLRFANASIEMSQTQESAIRGAESDPCATMAIYDVVQLVRAGVSTIVTIPPAALACDDSASCSSSTGGKIRNEAAERMDFRGVA